jgi:hypothetical protein
MRLEAHTIGIVDNPTVDDLRAAFLDEEWGDVLGNVYSLFAEDGLVLQSLSGDYFENFQLELVYPDSRRQVCTSFFACQEVLGLFVKFLDGDRSWMDALSWQFRSKWTAGAVTSPLIWYLYSTATCFRV